MMAKLLEKTLDTYYSLVPYHLRPGELVYRFKCWAWHRYSTVKPRHLPHTWVDRSHLMPHMMFEILSDFIEKECDEDCHVDWEASGHMVEVDGKQVNVRDEMQDLYDWWHQDYLKNRDNIYDEWHEHREQHVRDVFTRVDQDTADWVKSVDPEADEDDLEEWTNEYSSEEARIENERLFKEAGERETFYIEELNRRLHRLVNVISYMWT